MAYYRGTAEKQDRARAIVAVVLVHTGLAAIILSGLNVRIVHEAVERMTTIQIREPDPPPPEPPPPDPQPQRAREEEGAAGKKANPTPVVAPKPKIVVPAKSPIVAAPVAGNGSAASAGAALAGTGTGAGGAGSGRGGGGYGDFSRFTPARRISKIPDREYRRFVAASGMRRGTVGITIKVNTDGRASNCRVARSSGNPSVDALMCALTVQHVRFSPARDPDGRPVAQDISWYPDWAPNR